ncbi:hypothetical protein PHAVU_007G024000 [Phaseolus vulgaris]|uniref:GIR1-like zinc ribbon domain-containing protein n=1 Tax=Phaseolus vulgaris TaxID=3885 RepID=V7BAG3_PHAVU|nr:hypothetical protein PHAVU_007G024000g [Phaseolus vulgaris]ESW14867.1 hypothetical protein PHAVU_007G024000g [Phaseolus vulgaris]
MDPKVEAASKQGKKRSLIEIGINEYEVCGEIDLELKLSPPGSSSDNLLSAKRTPLPLSSERACLASKMDIGDNLDDGPKEELPPLIAMGCDLCLIYVMVSKANPKCPLCANSDLINQFQTKTSWC